VEERRTQTSQPGEETEQEGPRAVMESSPVARKAGERQSLHRKVSGLNGRPFTAAFLAAATGREASLSVSCVSPEGSG